MKLEHMSSITMMMAMMTISQILTIYILLIAMILIIQKPTAKVLIS